METKILTITTRGRFVIPAEFRRKFRIRKGTRILFLEENNRLVLQPVTKKYIRSLQGSPKYGKSA